MNETEESKVKTGKFIGYCKSCNLVLMEQDSVCPRCDAAITPETTLKEVPRDDGTIGG